ncbi:hypothetical protein RN001_010452 [Aquatica leii]|uniref:Peptidase S1 domain-containing protein n=1 Tax=Aquatica leii TaxID=1421715 RepID=A0AAN7P9L7_9COLE|nr:hypothetical protein RN001_010452 [Aquatica leii]
MPPLWLGFFVVVGLAHADVKHVLDGTAHPPPCYHPEHTNEAVPGSVAFWWADANSPFKQAYDYFKKCSSKDNCLPPIAASFQPPTPQKEFNHEHFEKNAFLNGQIHVASSTPKIDLSQNPFLNQGMQAAYSSTGQAVTAGSDGFLGVQPSVPFASDKAQPFSSSYPNNQNQKPQFPVQHPLGTGSQFPSAHPGEPCKCIDKNSCPGQNILTGQCDVATQVCCRLSNSDFASSYSNLSHITTGKSSSGSVIKFDGSAGLSPGSIQVISDAEPIPNPLAANPSNTIKVVRNTYNNNNVFASTIDYTNDNLGEYSFESAFQGPPYLPPLEPKPTVHYPTTSSEYLPPISSTTIPHVPTDTNINTQYVFPPHTNTPPHIIYPQPTTHKPFVTQNTNINNQYVTKPTTPKPTPGYSYPQPTPPFVYPTTPKPFIPIKVPPKPPVTPFVPKPSVTPYVPPTTQFVPKPSVTPFVPKPSVTPYVPPTTQFVPKPSVTPFVPKPSVTPFVPKPSVTPYVPPTTQFVPKPSVTPFVPKPSVTPFVPTPSRPTFISTQTNINNNYITPKPIVPIQPSTGGYSYPTPHPPFTIPPYQPQPSNTANIYQPTKPTPRPTTNQYLPPIVHPKPEPNLETGESTSGGSFVPYPQPNEPIGAFSHGSCAAALKCVQEIYCTAEGMISPTPVVLSKEQEFARVPTTDCYDRQAGVSGKCCRDPNYVDPWPSANSLNGVDDGKYKEDPRLGQYFPKKQGNRRSIAKRQAPQYQCGLRHSDTTPRGQGLEVNFAEIPWQAMVLRDTNRSLLCGGAIIKTNIVLTAAHCVEGLPTNDILIKGGEWKLGIDEEPLPFQIVKVAAIIRHPQYIPGQLRNDLALLMLDEHLRLAKNIAPICLPSPNQAPLQQCITTGWGKRILQVHLRGAIMRSVNVNLLTTEQCQYRMSYYNLSPYHYEPAYCGLSNNDQCDVDYGSALACTNGNGQYTLTGIFSWDTGCKDNEQIGGYIPPDIEWIESTSAIPLRELKILDKQYYQ